MKPDNTLQIALKYYHSGHIVEAERLCRKVLEQSPENAEALYFLGIISHQSDKIDSAVDYLKKSVEHNPYNPDAHHLLGMLLQQKGQLDKAGDCYQNALHLNPHYAEAYNNLGNVHKDKGNIDDAIRCYEKALQLSPTLSIAERNIGVCYMEKGSPDQAIDHYHKALRLNPHYADTYHLLGMAYEEKEDLNEAIVAYEKAFGLDPGLAETCNNLGNVYHAKGFFDLSLEYYRKALVINPWLPETHWNIARLLLMRGEFTEGWKEFEWRWQKKDFAPLQKKFSVPQWDGFDIRGKTIFLFSEQGIGDTIQFIRYADLISKMGAKVIVESQPEIKKLLESMSGIAHVVVRGDKSPECHTYAPLLSLPAILGTTFDTIPSEIPYLFPDPQLSDKWMEKTKNSTSELRIGITWAGNPAHRNNRNRSFPLAIFSPLAELQDIIFFSLQKGTPSSQAKHPPKGFNLIDYTEDIRDFSDTAALINNIDLVISADTAVAHLAGALGKPVWVLLPFIPDWRWLLEREDSPWYPTMRIFRQKSPGDWECVIESVYKCLSASLNNIT